MGVRSMPYAEAEGRPQFAGMGISAGSGGGGGSGGSSLTISTTETKVGTYLGKNLYSIAYSGYGSGSWTVIQNFHHDVVFAFINITAQSGDVYTQMCEVCKGSSTVEYKPYGTANVGTDGTLVLFYTKD